MLADHKYLERLIEQSQSAKGKGYELDSSPIIVCC